MHTQHVRTFFLCSLWLAAIGVIGCSSLPDSSDAGADGGTVDSGSPDAGSPDAGYVLDYYYGNQITGSYLTVDPAGTITHQERTCCPPTTVSVTEPGLGSSEMLSLYSQITSASAGAVVTAYRDGGAAGENYGHLRVVTSNGTGNVVVIREFGIFEKSINDAAAAASLRDFCNQYVNVDMTE